MKKLLSLPPNAVPHYTSIHNLPASDYFCTSDPLHFKLGSGGGTTWLLEQAALHDRAKSFAQWLPLDRRILIHAGGQSRRLPAYAAGGKTSIPIPVFRWARGQRINQTLFDLQLPLYEHIMRLAPATHHTLIASGDVFIRTTHPLQPIPQADIICYGLWAEPTLARNHGVFFLPHQTPTQLDFVIQKPTTQQLANLSQTHLALMDIGIWLLSDKAVHALRQHTHTTNTDTPQADPTTYTPYDLYTNFGTALGIHPTNPDPIISKLTVAILPLEGGQFYHYGTTPEIISSTAALQNLILDQRLIIQKNVKQHPTLFTQNTIIDLTLTQNNQDIWVENSHIPATWTLTTQHVLTGIPQNDWHINLTPRQCIDIQPIDQHAYALRPYGYTDTMRGPLHLPTTTYLSQPVTDWLANHNLTPTHFHHADDIQAADLFPVSDDLTLLGRILQWMLDPMPIIDLSLEYLNLPRLSADDIAAQTNLQRQHQQRQLFLAHVLPLIASNYNRSVFYQTDLAHLANLYSTLSLPLPSPLPDDAPPLQRMHDAMFRSQVLRLQDHPAYTIEHTKAFTILQQQLIQSATDTPQQPHLSAHPDQIVWARSAVRIDIAGGWTDTPPYCLLHGGNVLNLAIHLNGQQPLQVYLRPTAEHHIQLRSIDLGAVETITTYEQLQAYNAVGSPFSIPKAALALAGFHPNFSAHHHKTLSRQLQDFGSGIELTLLSAIPAGSGLGTSSILAATVLAALSDFCSLQWDRHEIGQRTLILEQLLTTGGGWQDQYGGILPGIKLLQTTPGLQQTPVVRTLPDTFFRQPEYQQCHLLYYTGITRTAKHILTDIVRSMFLNSAPHLDLLAQMKQHTLDLYDAIQLTDFQRYGTLIRQTWTQNRTLDSGTEPPSIRALTATIDDLCLGYKLPGAGGGGYLYMVAKDPEAAARIRTLLTANPLTPSARFVDLTLSDKGLQVTRS